jgi:hypothetical protein
MGTSVAVPATYKTKLLSQITTTFSVECCLHVKPIPPSLVCPQLRTYLKSSYRTCKLGLYTTEPGVANCFSGLKWLCVLPSDFCTQENEKFDNVARIDLYCNLFKDADYNLPPLWSSGQSSWLVTQRSRVRLPELSDFMSSSWSGTGSTRPCEDK